ncbi:SUMF1/EgtB/PvdO family nonheme iron enzyme [Parabacteroides sp. PF5-9]|uniref:SUMF1/EgtB/PvdO family nonheme iron enzyme n=1 Tax=Parabacteroides sp. PF5-9 TaxID=1742404 RepID=UPI002475FC26|nr:SUMF1/EgtB/PvdO family nonheme iron enzyme [Parabacteroides sp. PF5-9]MDH6358144.1 sulfatase modifying factor 1 [Parabacteroides sp. PF5-9]
MAANRLTNRYSSTGKKRGFFRGKLFILCLGLILGAAIMIGTYNVSIYLSTDESCMVCHVHPHVEDSWKLSKHVNNGSGVTVHCVDCHLPPRNHTWDHYSAKAQLGIKDLWGYLTKDSIDFNWETKSELEHAVKYIPNASCKECHTNLFPAGITDDGITAHLYYDENEKKLDLQCISCHLDAGHYNPNYSHSKMTGIPGAGTSNAPVDTSLFFKEATPVTSFTHYTEQIPGSLIAFNMKAVPGGTFQMGSTAEEPFHKQDEAPVRSVTVAPFFMAEVEVTWDMFWAFYGNTMSEGRTPPEAVYANNSRADVDAISGPTPPFGLPDQGWGSGNRPAITMTHYAAETFCQWLSLKTGKKYRLPTEAEWEYAARGGTETPYFFPGSPKDFSDQGFWRKFFDAKTDSISSYVIYSKNSKNKTQEPDMVKPNPFGLKNMLGNVMEYCADKYDPEAYTKSGTHVTDPLITTGEEYVVRGGNYTSDAADVRAAARDYTKHEAWLRTDPQQPKSIWWYSDIRGIGFRVVCEPDPSIGAR